MPNKSRKEPHSNQQALFDMIGVRSSYAGGLGSMATSMLPPSDWKLPDSFPDLKKAKRIGIDIESFDPYLSAKGPGFVRGDAHVIGVSVAVEGFKAYYPVRHKEGPNLPPNVVFSWLKDVLGTDVPKVGANVIYDLEGLHAEGVTVRGPILDIQNAEALLDEENALFDFDAFKVDFKNDSFNHSYETSYNAFRGMSLDSLAWKHLRLRKNEALLSQIQKVLKVKNVKEHLNRLPAKYVGPYAEDDAALALQVIDKQLPRLQAENMEKVWKLECDLVPLLLKMRFKGVKIDVDKAEKVRKELIAEEESLRLRIKQSAGVNVDPWSSTDLEKLCKANSIPYRRTPNGNPSFTSEWLKLQTHPALSSVMAIRKVEKMRRDFIEACILESNVKGRLHSQFHQLRSDEDGARSGRFSSSNVNLQQIPARDERFGPLIRGLFIPDDGCKWGCSDYSGQEPRLTVHYAHLCNFPGAAEAVRKYCDDPDTDYHTFAADLAFPDMEDRKKARKNAKEINLGLAYGMGIRKLAWKMGFITEAQSEDRSYPVPKEVYVVLDKYHEGLPFIKPLMERATNSAANRGYIKTELGRRRHFLLFSAKSSSKSQYVMEALPYSLAKSRYGNDPIARVFTHKALNALIQGSAADMMKQAMVYLHEAGYVPSLTVHDEIDDSIESEKNFKEIQDIMVNAVRLSIPIKVDAQLVNNWGEAK